MNNRSTENLSLSRNNFVRKIPTSKIADTHELMAEAFERNSTLKDKLPRRFGVEIGTVNSWARPKPSDHNPVATGKGNPLDRTEAIIDETHVSDPEMARKLAEHFSKFVDLLDLMRGYSQAIENENPCAAIAKVVEAQAKLIHSTIKGCDNRENAPELLSRTQNLKTCVIQLEGCLQGLVRGDFNVESG